VLRLKAVGYPEGVDSVLVYSNEFDGYLKTKICTESEDELILVPRIS